MRFSHGTRLARSTTVRTLFVLPVLLFLAACGPSSGGVEPDANGPLPDGGTVPDAAGGGPDAGGSCTPETICELEFTFPAAGVATGVILRGDFAADGWTAGAPMVLAGDHYTVMVPVTDQQIISYKFFVDGAQWVEDPVDTARLPDGFGGYNSVRSADCGTCAPAHFDWRDGLMYFVFVDRFANGDPANDAPVAAVEGPANYAGGDLAGVLAKINEGYFDDLGVNVLWLTSPVDNADGSGVGDDGHLYSAYHGYWPKTLDAVESRFGTVATLQAVVDAAHAHGLKVVLDYVMNHVHQESPTYADHPGWFWPLDNCVCGEGCSWDSEPDRIRCWFRAYLPDFDFANSDARDYSVANALQWAASTGVDGFRLDAVKHIDTSWLTTLRARLNAEVASDGRVFYLVGETYTGDRDLIRSYVDPATKLDGQFDFPLRAEIVRMLLMRQGAMGDLVSFLDGNDGYYGPGAVMGTFVGNHDLPRTIHLAEDTPMFGEWDSGKSRAWFNQPGLPGYAAPFERLLVAWTLLLTSQGVPLIYYGDEIGMAGAGDPDNRRMMTFAGLSAEQTTLRNAVAKLGQLRAAHAALRTGERRTVGVSQDAWTYAMIGGGEVLYVVLNRGDASTDAPGLPPGDYRDLTYDVDVSAPMTVPPRSARVLAAKVAP